MRSAKKRPYVIVRDNNVVHVDFGREPDPPAPKFPGAAALREGLDNQSTEPFCGKPMPMRSSCMCVAG
jgi:hypothetical protein